MGQQTDVTLNSRVYARSGAKDGLAVWWYRNVAGIQNAFSKLTQRYREPTTGEQIKIDHSLAIPVVATADTACSCAGTALRESTVTISVWVPRSSTKEERTDLVLSIQDLVSSATFVSSVEDLDPVFGG